MTIASLFSSDLRAFLQRLEELGFSLCLVGGASRDFLSGKGLSQDLDFEMRGQSSQDLKDFLKKNQIQYTELPYEIIRVDFQGLDLEFSTPRIEQPIVGNKGHHHFEAVLDSKLSYGESFKRRDFTLNAIGIGLQIKDQNEQIIDPFGGVSDLKAKVLKKISNDFFLDSVRFLRLVRFSVKYHYSIDENLKKELVKFDLSELSPHYFKEEMLKSQTPGPFINFFNELVCKYKLTIPDNFNFWNELTFSRDVKTYDDLLASAFLQNKEIALKLSIFFSLPEKRIKDLKSFEDSFQALKSTTKQDLHKLVQTPLENLKDYNLLKHIKNLEDKKEWRKYFSEKLIFSWENWESVHAESSEVEKTPAPLRSYLRYYKALKKDFGSV